MKKIRNRLRKPGSTSYRAFWDNFRSVGEAREFIYNSADEAVFDAGGQMDAEWMRAFLAPTDRVLDVGCGIGRIERFLAPHCAKLCGVDISGSMLQEAKKRLADYPHVDFVQNNGQDLSVLGDASFDFVFSFYVLQHVEREDAFVYLREIARVLETGGQAFLQFPLLTSKYFDESFVNDLRQGPPYHGARPRLYTVPESLFYLLQVGLCPEEVVQRGEDFFVRSRKGDPDRNTFQNLRSVIDPFSAPRLYGECVRTPPPFTETLLDLDGLARQAHVTRNDDGTLTLEVGGDGLLLEVGVFKETARLISFEIELTALRPGEHPDFSLGLCADTLDLGDPPGPYLQTDSGHAWTLRARDASSWHDLPTASKHPVEPSPEFMALSLMIEGDLISVYDSRGWAATARFPEMPSHLYLRAANSRAVFRDFQVKTP